MNEPTSELVDALAKAQAEFPAIAKGHTNPHFKSKYADLADVLAAVRPVLNRNGIFASQPIHTDENGLTVLSTELHGHGGVLSSELPLYLADLTPQQLGSTLTYYRRYSLAALLGVAAEDDDDGNAAQQRAVRVESEAPELSATRSALREAISTLSDADKELVKVEIRNKGVPTLTKSGATQAQLDELIEFISGLRERQEPFDLTGAEPVPPKADQHGKPFEPKTFDEEMKRKSPQVRASMRRED